MIDSIYTLHIHNTHTGPQSPHIEYTFLKDRIEYTVKMSNAPVGVLSITLHLHVLFPTNHYTCTFSCPAAPSRLNHYSRLAGLYQHWFIEGKPISTLVSFSVCTHAHTHTHTHIHTHTHTHTRTRTHTHTHTYTYTTHIHNTHTHTSHSIYFPCS
jgi:hypothetical protein